MQLILDEAQRLLAKNAREVVLKGKPLARLRSLRDSRDSLLYSPSVWAELVDLGFAALPFSQADGGLGLGMLEVALVAEALGSGLAPEPYLGTVMLAGLMLSKSTGYSQRRARLEATLSGRERGALACYERATRFSLVPECTRAARKPQGYSLSGEKTQVLGGAGADWYVVSAFLEGDPHAGVGLFMVPAGAPGLKVTPQFRLDSRNAASITLVDVQVGESELLAPLPLGLSMLEQVVERATVALCGEMLGAMQRAFDMTLEYLRERKQFGVPIASFQALRHRAARMFIERELSRSAVMAAARALDTDSPEAGALVCTAKARCSDAYLLIANESIQLHGGIGMTDEHDIGFFLKHARACEMTFGDAAFQRRRFATQLGF